MVLVSKNRGVLVGRKVGSHLPDDLALFHGLRGLDVGQRVPERAGRCVAVPAHMPMQSATDTSCVLTDYLIPPNGRHEQTCASYSYKD